MNAVRRSTLTLRRVSLVIGVAAIGTLLLPRETAPPTGGWLGVHGLKPQTARAAGFDLRYVRKGDGPTVVLLHGLASSIYSWADVIEPLSQRFDVIAVDLPGFGESTKAPDLAFATFEPAMLAFLDEVGVSRAHLVGNSMGGAIALALASAHPARVDRVVILDSAGFDIKPGERPFMIRVIGSRTAAAVTEILPVRRAVTAATLRYLMHDDARVSEERIAEYVAPLLKGGLASAQSLLRSALDDGFEASLQRINAPTLVIWGRYDPWLKESHADRFLAAIRGSRKVVLDAGHMPQEDRPQEVARLITEFLVS